MCGITGIISFDENAEKEFQKINSALETLAKRGPDSNGTYTHNKVALGHTRLAIIDVSNAAAQPFTDNSGRYTIVFNGEIYNFQELKKSLLERKISFRSSSDTEVLLYLYITEGVSCFEKLNGEFAFAIYDKVEESTILVRDRYGIKPLYYYQDTKKFIFGSELKALLAFGIPKEIDEVSLQLFLHLNYIPSPDSILKNVKKIPAGNYFWIKNKIVDQKKYYEIPYSESYSANLNYDASKKYFSKLLNKSVEMRLIADVPVGAFLSGGIDSSIITALASKHTKNLHTFSIGFKNEPLFDETVYAEMVAKMHKTNHTVFSLSNEDLFSDLFSMLDDMDEPFADSSALAVFILSKHTRKQVKVALSGDGADELFGGYNKHAAELKARNIGIEKVFANSLLPILNILPKSRNSKIGNKIRQATKFLEGINLSEKERYWLWAGFTNDRQKNIFLNDEKNKSEFTARKNNILKTISADFNSVLYTDMQLVLENDMLVKVDRMSMANSLEVRSPFMDHHIVDFAFSLPSYYKIDKNSRKKILKETFKKELPEEIIQRPKQGFEVPLLKWFQTDLKSLITEDLLSEKFILEQGIFDLEEIQKLKEKLFSNNPNDSVARVWGLIVFQYWYKKTML
ncbi:MAG: asparagine synthase (glutamine-hydrolyzing) [Bacteroidia bacterium]